MGMEGLPWGSVGEEKEGTPGWGMGEVCWRARRWKGVAGRDRQSSPGHRQGEGQVAQEGADRLGNSWAKWDVERWGVLRRKQGGIEWDAQERGRMLGNRIGY